MPVLSTRIHESLSRRLAKLAQATNKPVSGITKEAIDIGLARLEVRQFSDPVHTLAALCNAMSLGTEPPHWAWSTMAGLVYEGFRRTTCEFVTSGTVRALGRFLLAGYGALPPEEERTFVESELLSTLNSVDRYNMGRNPDVPRAVEALLHTSDAFAPTFVARSIADCLPAVFSENQLVSTSSAVNAAASPFFQDIYPMAVYGLRLTTPPSEITAVLPGKNELFERHGVVSPLTIRSGDVEVCATGWHVPSIECYAWMPAPARARLHFTDPFALCGGLDYALERMSGFGGQIKGEILCGNGLRITRCEIGDGHQVGLAVDGMVLGTDEPSLQQLRDALLKLLQSQAFIAAFRRWRNYAGTIMVPNA